MSVAEEDRPTCELCGRQDSALVPVSVVFDEHTYCPKVCAACRRRGEWSERAYAGLKWCPLVILVAVVVVPGFQGWPLIAAAIAWLAALRFVVWTQLPRRIVRRAQELEER